MAELGRAALIVCLGLSVYALCAGSLAAYEGRRRLAASAQNALVAAFAAAAVASGVLVAALVRHDFSFTYVADFTSDEAAVVRSTSEKIAHCIDVLADVAS